MTFESMRFTHNHFEIALELLKLFDQIQDSHPSLFSHGSTAGTSGASLECGSGDVNSGELYAIPGFLVKRFR